MSWYGQSAAGFWKAGPEDVVLLPRDGGSTKKDAAEYRRLVWDTVEALGPDEKRWIAPQGHGGDDGAKEMWVWQFPNTAHFLEALYVEGLSVADLDTLCALHRGMGWRFPKLLIFDREPSAQHLSVLRSHKCPWGIEAELRSDVTEPPSDPTLIEKIKVKVFELQALIGQL